MSIIFPPVVDTYQQGYMTTRPNDLPTYTGEDLVLTYRDPNEQGQRLVELSIRDQYTNHSIFSNRRETAIVSGLLLAPYEDFAISTTKTTLNCKFEQRADNPTLIRFQKVDNGTKVETLPKGYNNYLKLGSISFTPGATYRFSIKDETGDTLETLPVSLWIYDNNDRECEFAAGQESRGQQVMIMSSHWGERYI